MPFYLTVPWKPIRTQWTVIVWCLIEVFCCPWCLEGTEKLASQYFKPYKYQKINKNKDRVDNEFKKPINQ